MILPLLAGVAGIAAAAPLHRALDEVLDADTLRGATLAVVVLDPASGELLYERQADTLLLPASTLKWPTAVAAAELLGLDFHFETTLGSTGRVVGGVLDGDLVVVGGGDPSLGREDPEAVLATWVDAVRSRGVTEIRGAVVADPTVLGDPYLGSGWAWDDLPFAYSAPLAGLNLGGNEHALRLHDQDGTPRVDGGPFASCLDLDVDLHVGAGGALLAREPWRQRWLLAGVVPPGSTRTLRTPLADPPSCVAAALRSRLVAAGIAVRDEAAVGPRAGVEPWSTLPSPPLADLLEEMLKRSDNLIAEAVVRAVDPTRPRTYRGAREAVVGVLVRAGVDPAGLNLADGSGLSRYNLVSARALAELSAYAWALEAHAPLRDMLPVAGVDGTLGPRLRGTAAAGRVRAKTGSMTGVRNLIGYVRDAGDRDLVVAMLFTGFVAPQPEAIAVQDRALELIARSRRGRVKRLH